MLNELKFHHVGLIVRDIDEAILHYKALFGNDSVSIVYFVKSQDGSKHIFTESYKSHKKNIKSIKKYKRKLKVKKKKIISYKKRVKKTIKKTKKKKIKDIWKSVY